MSDIFDGHDADGDEMSRTRPFSYATADHLLAGGDVDDPALQDLAQVLRAASAPGRAEELTREDAATAAFAAAHLAIPARSHRRRRPLFRAALAGSLGLKLAAAAIAAVFGGLALAATTGVLPNPLDTVPASSTPGPGRGSATAGPSRTPYWTPSPGATPTPLGSVAPQVYGLCKAYLNAGSADEKNKHLTQELITAAGGADRVEAYCSAVAGTPTPRPKPSTGSPKAKGSGQPKASRKATKPSAHPSR